MSKNLTISCPPRGLHEALKKEANIQSTSVSRLAARLLREGLERIKQDRKVWFKEKKNGEQK